MPMPALRPASCLALVLLAVGACRKAPEPEVWIEPVQPTTTSTLQVFVDGPLDWGGRGYQYGYGEEGYTYGSYGYYGYYGYYYGGYDYDAEYYIQYVRWAVEGTVQQDLVGDEVRPERTTRGQHWAVQAFWYDWRGRKDGVVTAQVEIGNALPKPPKLRIDPASPGPGDRLDCVTEEPASDADGDPLTVQFTWRRAGSVWKGADGKGWHQTHVPAGVTASGESWVCQAVADDTFDVGPVREAAVAVE